MRSRSRHSPRPPRRSCRARGVAALYTHQAAAIDALRAGRSVVVASGTASGKSLCYQVPIVESVVGRTGDTALVVYPTKALAQDQLRSFRQWLLPDLVAATYDGDTAPDDRTWARANANVLLTNPEMLHAGILPSHARWANFLMRLRYVVVDELHTFRGLFGSHVAHVLRRLRRLCAHYGASPTFCFTSATIGNPAALRPRCAVSRSRRSATTARRAPSAGSRCGNDRCSTSTAAHERRPTWRPPCCSRFVEDGHQSLAFTRSRRGAELVAAQARAMVAAVAPPGGPVPDVAAYRAGYLADERRGARGAPRRRFARRHRRHEHAGARDRHRLAGRRGAQRLPRHAGLDAPTGWPRRTGHASRGRGVGHRRRPARPVVRPSPPRAARSSRRGRSGEPGKPVRARRADRLCGTRAPARPRRRAVVRRGARRRRPRAGARRQAQAAW